MKVPLSWLAEYVDLNHSAEHLAHRLSMAGAEVEEIIQSGAAWENIYVGRVLKLEPHPDADRLRLVTVDIAQDEPQRVICGAPNVAQGQTIAFGTIGAAIRDAYSDAEDGERKLVKLKKAKIRGVESSGMVLSERELGLSDEHEGILVLDDALTPGTPLADALGETVFDITPTPNRPDHMSVLGIAREVAALTGHSVREPAIDYEASGPAVTTQLAVRIDVPDLCPRFVAGLLDGITVQPSPDWIQRSLIAAGQRPINNVVDVTNYVMLEFGQPLHAFDYDSVRGGELIVRLAQPGEKLRLLDGGALDLTNQHLLVADAEGPSSLAGVMGGEASEIKPTTTHVLLEAANWNGAQIRRTQTGLKLRTEAGARFEKSLNPELAMFAWQRAMRLLVETGGGQASSGVIDVYPGSEQPPAIHLSRQRVEQILGLDVPVERVRSVLGSLGFAARWIPPDKYVVNAPYWRTDVALPDDVIEEIGRIIGYDSLPSSALAGAVPEPDVDRLSVVREIVRDVFVAAGGVEVISYVTTNDELLAKAERSALTASPGLRLANPMNAERPTMRTSLRASLLEAYAANYRQRSGPLLLFEIGKRFSARSSDLPLERTDLAGVIGGSSEAGPHEGVAARPLDFFDVKALAAAVSDALGADLAYAPYTAEPGDQDPALVASATARVSHEGDALGLLGRIDPAIAAEFDITHELYLIELSVDNLTRIAPQIDASSPSRYPAVSEDFAVIVDLDVSATDVADVLGSHDLVEQVKLFDVYSGDQIPPGKKSLAYAVHYRAPNRTLSDKEIGKLRNGVIKQLERRLNATLRA